MALALRMGTDFVAGVLVGAALGWGLRQVVRNLALGVDCICPSWFAAGVLTVLRTAGLVKERQGGGDDLSGRAG